MSTLPKLAEGQSWACGNGCGECDIKESLFEYSRTEHPNGDVESKFQRVYVSKCCGADLMLWNEQKQDFDNWAYAEHATPPSPSTAKSLVQPPPGARVNSNLVLNEEAPSTASEVGELPPLPPHFGGIDIYHSNGRVEAYDGYTADQMREYGQECARAALASKPAAREVDVEAERKLFEKEANDARFFPAEIDFALTKSPSGRRDEYVNSHLQSRWEGWLAARRTQEGAKDAERFRQAIACEDSAEVLYGAVLSHAPNGKAIRNEFDAAIAATQTKEGQG